MTFTLGVFDVLTCAATGSLYVAFLAYVLDRLALVDVSQLLAANTTVLVFGLLLLSYVLGQLFYTVGEWVDKLVPGRQNLRRRAGARLIAEKVNDKRSEMIVEIEPHILLSGIELRAREAALEVTRLRAAGLGLRSCVPALAFAIATSLAEIFTSSRPLVAGIAAVLFALAAWVTARRGRELREWAFMKTFELAYWMPELVGPHGPAVHGSSLAAPDERR